MGTLGQEIPQYVNIDDKLDVEKHAKLVGCTDRELLFCVKKVGKSVRTITLYLDMNRDFVEIMSQNKEESQAHRDK